MNELALFASVGGGILGGKLLGWRTVCAVEIDSYRASVLLARQRDRLLAPFPIWDDVRTFDGYPWRGIADVVSGGFPCPDIAAGGTCEGIHGERSGLYRQGMRIVGEVRPRRVLLENSPLLTRRGLEFILFDLAQMGYDAKWGVLGADDAGANHQRHRIWIVASDPDQDGQEGRNDIHNDAGGSQEKRISALLASSPFPKRADDIPTPWVFGAGDGLAFGLDRVGACGDGQVPAVVRLAWETLKP